MIFSDKDIKKLFIDKKIIIMPEPNWETQLGPASVDFRLGGEFRVFNHVTNPYIDPKQPDTFHNLTHIIEATKEKPLFLQPGEFILGVTIEEIGLPNDIGARIEGRSSWGRLGVLVHSTAGYIDPGFQGRLTLEISNIGKMPVLLYPGMRICQIAFESLTSPAEVPYNKKKDVKYFGDKGPQESRIYKDM
ncbi:dCTP deaminase [Patescibacteria group bacterium]|nr:dCTP deaminase [Patescibacteria group bacterium]